jgi:PncC family amidohydrolase
MVPAIEEEVGALLLGRGMTLAVAESCTGGLIGHRLTNVPGSSAYFLGGCVTYGNRAKETVLGVEHDLLDREGAVSAAVARAMARGVRRLLDADMALAVTGIAGPSGGSPEKPVGLVFIALDSSRGTEVARHLFTGDRGAVKEQSADAALSMVKGVFGAAGA